MKNTTMPQIPYTETPKGKILMESVNRLVNNEIQVAICACGQPHATATIWFEDDAGNIAHGINKILACDDILDKIHDFQEDDACEELDMQRVSARVISRSDKDESPTEEEILKEDLYEVSMKPSIGDNGDRLITAQIPFCFTSYGIAEAINELRAIYPIVKSIYVIDLKGGNSEDFMIEAELYRIEDNVDQDGRRDVRATPHL